MRPLSFSPEMATQTNRQRISLKLLWSLLIILLLQTAADYAAADTIKRRVLILNSYHQGYTWSDNETAGVLEALTTAGLKTDPQIEYLDTKNFPQQEQFPQLRELFRVKNSLSRPALVLTLDDPAFDFAIRYRKELFNDIPIVFIGLNNFSPAMLKGEGDITGATEKQDFRGTINAALALQPETREVVIVHDYTLSGLATQREVMEQLAPLAGRISVRSLPELPIDGVTAALSELRSGSIVLAVSFAVDKEGRVFNHSELARLLSEKTAVPVYSTKVERLGHGIVGGSLMDGRTHGSQGGDLALTVLKQGTARGVPVVENPRSRLMFDYRQLVRFKIPLKRLPEGSRVVNRPQSFYAQHGQVINIAVLVIFILAASLIMVILSNRKRINAEAKLRESRERLHYEEKLRELNAELEQRIRERTMELEISNQELESFCYAVSHDLRAPLRHIESFCSILSEDHSPLLDDDANHYLNRICNASSRMGQLIDDLLNLSMVSRFQMNRCKTDLSILGNEILTELSLAHPERQVVWQVEEGLETTGDPQLLRIALVNLLGNAWKYTGKCAKPFIELGRRKTATGMTAFFVRDNGSGFNMQQVDKLFTPFQRLHDELDYPGTGIGLSIVGRIIHRHGGKIWAEAEEGSGATFWFTLEEETKEVSCSAGVS